MGIDNFDDSNGEGYVPLEGSNGTIIYYKSGEGPTKFYRNVGGVYRRLPSLDLGSDSTGRQIRSIGGRICSIDTG